MQMYIVDAFTEKLFSGNQAAVCVLSAWLEDGVLQKIAAENNLSETAFIVKKGDHYDLRWFTPKVEIDLCGHATLASAYIILNYLETDISLVSFETMSGILTVQKEKDVYWMNFPARKPVLISKTKEITEAFGMEPIEIYKSRDLLVLFESEAKIREIKPDFGRLSQIKDCFGFIISSKGDKADFVSRFFAPNAGVPEDPATGSSHCTLIPFWAERLGKSNLKALQLSERGGVLFCEDHGERVMIGGHAKLYLKGEINL
ncbi:PhzF family phenazine biosynthesis protein [Oscillospiraceae bacterium CM]|nr:PhzF family phenazine biosynthesis protein [Oscillospiraceae bacterium CM]